MRTFIFLLILSFNALAVDWESLAEGKTYKFTQNISLKQNERSGSSLVIPRGQKAQLKEIVPLSSAPVLLYIFHYQKCPGPAMTTVMEIIPVHGTSPVVEVGAQLEENCKLNIFIENKELMSKSFFQ